MYKTYFNASSSKPEVPLSAGNKTQRKYTALTRLDFNENIVNNWCEIKTSKRPPRRSNHISFIYKECLYIYGGMDINRGAIDDLYKLQIDKINNEQNIEWEKINYTGESPGKISNHKGCVIDNKLYIYGGFQCDEIQSNTLFILNLANFIWTKREFKIEQISPLACHSMSCIGNSKIAIFGGCFKTIYSNILYTYDIYKNIWLKYPENDSIDTNDKENQNKLENKENNEEIVNINSELQIPKPRIDHSQVTYNNTKIYIYGGIDQTLEYLHDFWLFDYPENKWTEIKLKGDTPKGLKGHSAILYKNQMVIFGGKIGNLLEINQLWAYDFTKNKFFLIHDTMLERTLNEAASRVISAISTSASTFNKINKTKNRPRKLQSLFQSPFDDDNYLNTLNDKKPNLADIYRMNRTEGNLRSIIQTKKNPYEDVASLEENVKNMKKSLIFKNENEDDQLFFNEIRNLYKLEDNDNLKNGVMPQPRDGHSCVCFGNSMYVFGGDRNKFPYNDLFVFNLNI